MGQQGHAVATTNADRRWLWLALALILGYMAAEVVVGLLTGSLALLSDAGHMLTDAVAVTLALLAMRLAAHPAAGRYTFGLKRAEILSAQANGATLLGLAVWFTVEFVRRMIEPPPVDGFPVFVTALAGIAVNLAATWSLRRANRTSLNVRGAYAHILNDLFAFVATAIAGLAVWLAGFARADAIAALVIAALMARAGWSLVRDSGQVLLEASPADIDPDALGRQLVELPSVREVHDLHVWQITSGQPALAAHVLVTRGADCHAVRANIERMLLGDHGIAHTTLQVDHDGAAPERGHCFEPHGIAHRDDGQHH